MDVIDFSQIFTEQHLKKPLELLHLIKQKGFQTPVILDSGKSLKILQYFIPIHYINTQRYFHTGLLKWSFRLG